MFYHLNKDTCAYDGEGEGIALLMEVCGIGDDISALPVLSELCKTEKVTIYTRYFHAPIFKGLNAEIVKVSNKICENGEIFDTEWDEKIGKKRFKKFYKLTCWGGWQCDAQGYYSSYPRDQFSEIIHCNADEDFDYKKYFGLEERIEKEHTVLAFESAEQWRSLYEEIAKKIFDTTPNCVWLTDGSKKYEHRSLMAKMETFEELLRLVYSAKKVISVDNGISHLCAALEVPLKAYFGLTQHTFILDQYKKYNPELQYDVTQGTSNECNAPCNRHPDRGMIGGLCSGKYRRANCMTEQALSLTF